ncbi:MAG: Rpn family recombination-promoting nuclease/putative transposase [Prevotellaceae bacterium]|nr:Rpn family recombination-promoting nuclease/putative transposase [Prevotellaceae bacterium]
MADLKDKYIRFDWAIKRLLRQKANFDVLEGFLTVFLNQEIKVVEILESESNQTAVDDKFNRVDIKARNSKGEIIIVEIQNTSELYYLERILYGVCKAVTEHIKLGNTYKEVKKVYSISILYFDLGIGDDYLYIGQNNFIGVHTNDQLVVNAKEKNVIVRKSPSDIFPTYYIVRVNNFNKYAVTPLEEWVDYLKNGVIREDTTAPGLQEAREKLLYYSMNDAERHAYDEHINAVMIQNDVLGTAKLEGLTEGRIEGHAEGLAEGLVTGRAEGMADEKVNTARKMLSLNIPIETIMEVTGLSEEDIRNSVHYFKR